MWCIEERNQGNPHAIWITFGFHQQIISLATCGPIDPWNRNVVSFACSAYFAPLTLKSLVPSQFHFSPRVVHLGFTKTYEHVKHSFFWDGMKSDICTFVAKCDTCQCNKGKTGKPRGTLQLLPLPPTIWTDICLDFIVGLPKSTNTSLIFFFMSHP